MARKIDQHQLTAEAQARFDAAQSRLSAKQAEFEKRRGEILERARQHREASLARRAERQRILQLLRAERVAQELRLVDVERSAGFAKTMLSRLENDPDGNPTLDTLQRYAMALGKSLIVTLGDAAATTPRLMSRRAATPAARE